RRQSLDSPRPPGSPAPGYESLSRHPPPGCVATSSLHLHVADSEFRYPGESQSYPPANLLDCAMTGRRIVTCAPVPRLRTPILPLCSSTIFLTMASPRPVPLNLLVTYGSNGCANIGSANPGPLSAITSS